MENKNEKTNIQEALNLLAQAEGIFCELQVDPDYNRQQQSQFAYCWNSMIDARSKIYRAQDIGLELDEMRKAGL